jgi:molybdate-binding protein/DNA-binding XRE family transcriptional regulator
MKKEGSLHNRLKAVRTRLGLSQQELAAAAGVARQTIGGIEAGTYALSLTVALHLAKALGCSVDELFWLEGDLPVVRAQTPLAVAEAGVGRALHVSVAQIGGRWIAYPLTGELAFPPEMIPADGIAAPVGAESAPGAPLSVQLLDTPDALLQTVVLAGCTPSLSLWARSAERWHPGLRVRCVHANSTAALDLLARGEVHAAGVHLVDPVTGDENTPFVRRRMGAVSTVLVTLGVGEEGLLVAPGNPKGLRVAADLARAGVTVVNREEGSGARLLLDSFLDAAGIRGAAVAGYDHVVGSHLAVAREIAIGRADVGVSAASVAAAFGLAFVSLRSVRYDMALRSEYLELEPVQRLLDTLQHRSVRLQLASLGGYDTSRTGDVLPVV